MFSLGFGVVEFRIERGDFRIPPLNLGFHVFNLGSPLLNLGLKG